MLLWCIFIEGIERRRPFDFWPTIWRWNRLSSPICCKAAPIVMISSAAASTPTLEFTTRRSWRLTWLRSGDKITKSSSISWKIKLISGCWPDGAFQPSAPRRVPIQPWNVSFKLQASSRTNWLLRPDISWRICQLYFTCSDKSGICGAVVICPG